MVARPVGNGRLPLLLPLDGLRRLGLLLLLRLLGAERLRALLCRRELRVAVGGSLSVALALGLTLRWPLLLLALSPLFLGVPHLLADLRYLVAQPGYHRRWKLAIPVGGALLLAGVGLGMQAGLGALLLVLLLAGERLRQAPLRRLGGALVVAALLYYGRTRGFYWLELGLAHLHNFVAVLLFYLWRRRGDRLHLWPLGLFGLATLGLLAGWLEAPPQALLLFASRDGLDVGSQRATLAPLLAESWATRLLLLFAFAQAVHYAVWLRLIPEEARQRPAPRPWHSSLRALVADLGLPLLVGAGLCAVALAAWATVDLNSARNGYFQLALFHGYLELCVLALWWIEGSALTRAVSDGAVG